MLETHTLQGEIIIGNMVHGAAINCMVVPYGNPENWFFQQFATQQLLDEFAIEHKLVMKRKDDESNNRP